MDQARHWIARFASGSISEDEMARFRRWRAAPGNDRIFKTERALWRELASIESAFSPGVEPRRQSRAVGWIRRKCVVTGAAAAAAVAFLAVIVTPELSLMMRADHRTAVGEVRQITLADGSSAFLDTASAIAVHFDDDGRDITLLSGRAWFSVQHRDERPFRVSALGGVTEDVGTAFEVDRTDGKSVKVGVTDGVVRVAPEGGGAAVILKAGEHAQYAKGQRPERVQGGAAEVTAVWRDGELLVRNVPVRDAIQAISRYRSGMVFTLGDWSGLKRISGTFRTDRSEDALITMAQMRELRLTYLPAGVVLVRPSSSD